MYQDLIEGLRQTIEEKDAKIKQLEDALSNLQNKPIKKSIQKKKDKRPTKKRPQSAVINFQSEPSDSRFSFSYFQVLPKANKLPQTPQKFQIEWETLYINNMHLKQENNELKLENLKLKTLVQQLQARILKIERVDRYQLQVDPLGMSTSNNEGCIVPLLKAKIKEQAQIIEELTIDLRNQYKSVKSTSILELQKQIKNQQDEIIKMKQLQQIALKITDQEQSITKILFKASSMILTLVSVSKITLLPLMHNKFTLTNSLHSIAQDRQFI